MLSGTKFWGLLYGASECLISSNLNLYFMEANTTRYSHTYHYNFIGKNPKFSTSS